MTTHDEPPHEKTRHRLVVIHSSDGARLGRCYDMPPAEAITAGRHAENAIVLDGGGVSRRHARFELRDSRWWVVDVGSTNGVRLNDEETKRARLSCGDRVSIGETIFKLVCGDDGAPFFDDRQIFEPRAVDGLTGLLHRRGFNERLEAEALRAASEGAPLAIALCDLDHLKKINDARGHLAGDHVLRELASVARSLTRAGDALARYGGDEFVWLMPGATLETAAALAEQLRAAVQARSIEFEGASISLTVSAGVAALGAQGPLAALAAADERLEHAKRAGRNRVAS